MAGAGRTAAAVIAAAAAGVALSAAIRYGLAQSPTLGWRCGALDAPWWCPLRGGLLAALRAQALGVLGLTAGLWALLRRRWSLGSIAAAAFLGGAGLLAYSAGPSAAGALMAALRAARSPAAEPGSTHAAAASAP